ncbi:hypothetical protein B0H67DRAFT_481894, partial [Lasiosphaeris hirsuta]
FHSIAENRLRGSAKLNLDYFRGICRQDAFKRVAMVTNMWGRLGPGENGNSREQELVDKDEFWGSILRDGAQMERHDNTAKSAFRLMEKILASEHDGKNIQIVSEMKDGTLLSKTTAGESIRGELSKLEKVKSQGPLVNGIWMVSTGSITFSNDNGFPSR